jgi:hypothetical protein
MAPSLRTRAVRFFETLGSRKASQDEAGKHGKRNHAASTRRKPFHIAVAAPEVSTGSSRSSW